MSEQVKIIKSYNINENTKIKFLYFYTTISRHIRRCDTENERIVLTDENLNYKYLL